MKIIWSLGELANTGVLLAAKRHLSKGFSFTLANEKNTYETFRKNTSLLNVTVLGCWLNFKLFVCFQPKDSAISTV